MLFCLPSLSPIKNSRRGQRNLERFLYLQLEQVLYQVVVFLLGNSSALNASKESMPARLPLPHHREFGSRIIFYSEKKEVDMVKLNP